MVIGAGMTGITAAHTLQKAGRSVIILEKARGIGGRMSTRRSDEHQWDHGAQYFTAEDKRFVAMVESWQAKGIVKVWETPIGAWDGQHLSKVSRKPHYVGTPKLNAPLHDLAEGIDIRLQTQVTDIEKHEDGWHVFTPDLEYICEELVLAIPSPQAVALLPPKHPFYEFATSIKISPCWALLVHTPVALPFPYGGIYVNQGPIRWIANNSTKPGRASSHDGTDWVIHATPEWSLAHLEATADDIAQQLLAEFEHFILKQEPAFRYFNWQQVQVHRWRYSRYFGQIQLKYALHEDSLTLAGDWLSNGRIEGAFLSGLAAAEAILENKY
ncbi:NAD(P)/FAD-dependent oxidoreductase [Leeia speluncae]|uniref:NAD(P)/FAD-dependent oxidoreductase n=1 Tax=Leeia speluncae TaxID=2884804 RepID=UPI003571167E